MVDDAAAPELPPADLALLRRFEPVLRYTRGERFFPLDVAPYVHECSLWVQRPNEAPVCLVPDGQLTLAQLAEPRAHGFEARYFLKFIEPLDIAHWAAFTLRERLGPRQDTFHAGRGRLGRVGYGSRFVDALFSLSLLARGRVPGDTAAAAALAYRQMMDQDEHYRYHARVLRENGWIALQYWFLYAYNNWRSGFFGVNDHEADWEMITLYLSEPAPGVVQPDWVAYASHDFSGDDLRRHWTDPEVDKVGEHVVVYAGAGSHASYYQPGEYLAELELPFLAPLVHLVDEGQRRWRRFLRQVSGAAARDEAPAFNIFRIPFVDYARGDGRAIGPGQERGWDPPRGLEPAPGWALRYRGLWGLYAQDPIAGENAPAGPAYNRDGSLRRAWYDPLGWAGLDKLPPPHQALDLARQRQAEVATRAHQRRQAVAAKQHELLDLNMEAAAMTNQPHLRRAHQLQMEKVNALAKEIAGLRAQLAAEEILQEALAGHIARLERGEPEPLRAHLHHAHLPASDQGQALGRVAEIWAAVSIGVLLIGFVGMALFAQQYLAGGLIALVAGFLLVEAGLRRQLPQLIPNLTLTLALICALILFVDFFWMLASLAVLVAGGYIMWENLRELRR